jgi:hypothetical protein
MHMRKITALLVIVLSVFLTPSVVWGQRIGALPNPVVFPDLESIINFFLGLIRPIVILALVGTLMYGGWTYLNAKDNDKEVERAKKILTAAVVGFVIIVLAPVIVQFAGSLLGVRGGLFDFQTAR